MMFCLASEHYRVQSASLFFLVVITDFPRYCEFTKCYLCADDAKIFAINNETQLVQSDLDNISLWCFEKWMTLNAGKCKQLKFRGSSELFMGPHDIEQVPEIVDPWCRD